MSVFRPLKCRFVVWRQAHRLACQRTIDQQPKQNHDDGSSRENHQALWQNGGSAQPDRIYTKDRKLEDKDALKRRIDEAAKFAPIEQLALSPQCGFSSGIGGNTMTIDEEITKLRRMVEVTREVWGTA